ncbi:MAG TPA: hypothetical protein ENN80_00350 [Candidatus Hydrogenedentes bacterium]|nr:hypothetical protein [Candidatus Hydrogenedentota bacterium]
MTAAKYLGILLVLAPAVARGAPPEAWVDEETGHRVVLLSRREGDNGCFYFHQNPFTMPGDKMVFIGATNQGRSAFTVDLDSYEVEHITPEGGIGHEIVAAKRRELFYLRGEAIYATHLDSHKTRRIAETPPHWRYGRGLSVNADETLLLGCYALGEEAFYEQMPKDQWYVELFEASLPNALYTIDITTGETNEFYHSDSWLGHAQFSPTDPGLVAFCHEGPGRRLDRMWLVRVDGSGLRKVRERTVPDEFVTHEFWHSDGSALWFDLQLPRLIEPGNLYSVPWYLLSKAVTYIFYPQTYIARLDINSEKEERFRVDRAYYSWHYNTSHDGTMLCGDGEGRNIELRRGKYINLYRIDGDTLSTERLCSLADHSYRFAPNARFTPDDKWVVFQADIHATPQVYAVEVAPAGG